MPQEFTKPFCPRSWWTSLDCTNYCECFFCTCSLLKSTRFRERVFHRRWLWMTWRSFQGCLKREEDLNPAPWKQFRASDVNQQRNSEWCNAKFSYRAASARVLLPTSWEAARLPLLLLGLQCELAFHISEPRLVAVSMAPQVQSRVKNSLVDRKLEMEQDRPSTGMPLSWALLPTSVNSFSE